MHACMQGMADDLKKMALDALEAAVLAGEAKVMKKGETVAWLHEKLIRYDDGKYVEKNGIKMVRIAAFRNCGCMFVIYKSNLDGEFCVHSDDSWKEGTHPNIGYFSASYTWDELVDKIAERYVEL